jgi:hypothetical protein
MKAVVSVVGCMPLLDRGPLFHFEAPANKFVAWPVIEVDHQVAERTDITAEAG